MSENSFIPVNVPLLNGNERKYLLECIDTGWISSEGPFIKAFEEGFAARVGRRHGVAVTNGTAALDAAVEALGIQEGDEVILPSFTIISCAGAIVRAGGVPVVVDSDPFDWNMRVDQIESRITPKTKAIMAVHLYGLPVDMDPLLEIAHRHHLLVIEDAAQMHGQLYKGRPCGSFGDISTFSFYPNKLITTGEGGMIVTNDDALAERCRSLRNLCFQPQRRFVHEELGWNLRMTNMQAALGLAQLEKLDATLARKREIGRRYLKNLQGVKGLQLPLEANENAESLFWVFGVVLDDHLPIDAQQAMQDLGKKGIGTRPFFWPMHEQPLFLKQGLFADTHLPVAERLGRRGFYVPSGVALINDEIDRVSAVVRDYMTSFV